MKKETIRNFGEAVDYIFRIPRFTSKNTMEDTRAFLKKLGNPDREMKIIHVAGTNGKGSVCAYLRSVLNVAGCRVALFTSPHLVDVRERFTIDGEMVSEEAFLEAFLKVYEALPWEELAADKGYHPTFFEYLFFMAMLLFKEKKPAYCILETGLGGRLDATNAVSHKEMAVITHMGLDHTEYLGNTLTQIAKEKAGIMQKGAPVIFWNTDKDVEGTLTECAEKLGISAFPVSKADYTFLKNNNKSIDFSYRSLYYDSVRLHINTIAAYQQENATLAVRALEILLGKEGSSPELLKKGVETAFWAGRMEEVMPDIYVDGAHNEDGIRAFLETVAQDNCQDRRLFFGVVKDKAYGDMIKEIADSNLFTEISAVQLQGARALPVEKTAEMFARHTGKQIRQYPSVREAFAALSEGTAGRGGRTYIAGSLYLVGEIKELI